MKSFFKYQKQRCKFLMKVFSLLILVSTGILSGQGERNYLFENISIPEGLSNSEVQSIFQDSNGFLWISTSDGLNRYDGYNIKIFKNDPSDSASLPDNYCGAITEDKDGFIWVGVFGNVIAKYNPINETFTKYPIETANINSISDFLAALYDSKENLWFGTTNHGMQKFNKTKNKFELVKLDSTGTEKVRWGQIYDVIELKNGNILASDFGSGIKIYTESLNFFQPYFLKTNYSPDQVADIHEDVSGNIWFGGYEKLLKYSPAYYAVEDYDIFSQFQKPTKYDYVTSITQDTEGYVWASVYSQGLFRINLTNKDIRRFDYNFNEGNTGQNVTWKLYQDKYGVIWIGTWFGGLSKFDPLLEPFNFSKLKSDEISGTGVNFVTSIAGSQSAKNLIVGTSTKGLFAYNRENKKTTGLSINFLPSTVQDEIINVQALVQDDKSNIWFSYNNLGLYKFDQYNVLSSIESPNRGKTSGYVANAVKTDLSGNIWISSRYGFEKYNPEKNEFSLLPTIMNKQMSKNFKNKLVEIPNSREPIASILEVGEASNLEKRFTLNNDQKVLVICVGEGRKIQDMLFDTGSLLTGDGKLIWSMNDLSKTFNNGGGFKNRIAIKCLDLKSGEYKIAYSSDVGHSFGNFNVLAPPDSLWWGIQLFNISDSEYNYLIELNEKEINSDKYLPMEVGNSIELSKRLYNVLWLGSVNNSFFKYELATGSYKQYNYDTKNKFSHNNFIRFILEDREGIVWVATSNNLLRFDPISEKIEKFEQKDGLPSNLINSIIEDLEGNLWINTAGGLSKLNKNAPTDKWNFVNFDTRDGLLSYSSSKANWISENGEILFGSNDGIISFFPGKINVVEPDIVIQDIKISDVSLKSDSAEVQLENSILKLDKLNLAYQQNNISFDFSSIHFSRPAKNKIVYKLEGFNNHWISTDRNFASFTNLDPGEYIFRVKGSNGDGIWNETGKAVEIKISPPWWQTTTAYISYFFIFVGIIFGIDRVQRRRIVTKERTTAAIKEAELRAQLAETENERKTKELEEARQLQLSMLPKDIPQLPHLDIAVYMKTATEVGGDYYDFHIGLDGTLTVVLGDATGHGMKAGTMVTTTKSLFNVLAPNPNIVETFHEMTRCLKLMQMEKLSMCMTMLKIIGNKIQMSAAGMPPVFIYKKENQTIEEHVMKGMPLGTFNNFPYTMIESNINSGDTILLMSDGFPELFNEQKEMYGYKRARNYFEEIAGESPENIISKLKNAGSEWVKDEDPDDDVTFVVIKVK